MSVVEMQAANRNQFLGNDAQCLPESLNLSSDCSLGPVVGAICALLPGWGFDLPVFAKVAVGRAP